MTETGGKAWAQTIFYPYLHASQYARGSVLLSNAQSSTHDTKDYEQVPDIDALAVYNDEKEELSVFAINRDLNDTIPLTVKLLNFADYSAAEHIEMSRYNINAVNTAASSTVTPKARKAPAIVNNAFTVKLSPLSWNVIRLKRAK